LSFNFLVHVITRPYKGISEEIIWQQFSWQICEISHKMPLLVEKMLDFMQLHNLTEQIQPRFVTQPP